MQANIKFFILFFIGLFTSTIAFAQSADVSKGCAPLKVKFTADQTLSQYFWDFDDLVTSNLPNPEHIFTDVKTHTVKLRDGINGPVIKEITIEVFNKPSPTISIAPSTSGCAPFEVNFTNTSSTGDPSIVINESNWTFGDNQGAPNDFTPTHTYQNPGTYDVSLLLKTNIPSCNVTAIYTDTILVETPPTAVFSVDKDFSCEAPLTTNINNQSTGGNLTYNWDFDGQATPSTSATPGAITFLNEGTFTINLTTTSDINCSASSSKTINIGSPKFDFLIHNSNHEIIIDSSCAGLHHASINEPSSIPFGTQLQWSNSVGFKNTTYTGKENDSIYLFNINNHQQDEITLIAISPNGQCRDTVVKSRFYEKFEVTTIPDEIETCNFNYSNFINGQLPSNINIDSVFWEGEYTPHNGNISSYFLNLKDFTQLNRLPIPTWHNPAFTTSIFTPQGVDPNSESPQNPATEEHIIDTSLLYNITTNETINFSAKSVLGCVASTGLPITIYPLNAIFYPNKVEGCAPLNVTFNNFSRANNASDFPITKYVWDFGDGNTKTETTLNSPNHIYTTPGEYEVKLTVFHGNDCFDDSHVFTIRVGEEVSANFSISNTTPCINEDVIISFDSGDPRIQGWNFNAEDNRSFNCTKETSINYKFSNKRGTQEIHLEPFYNGCISRISKDINVKGAVADFDYKIDCETPKQVEFTNKSVGGTQFTWSYGEGGANVITYEQDYDYTNTGSFNVLLIASNGVCPPDVMRKVIHIKEVEARYNRDTILCINQPYTFDASPSIDEHSTNASGYQWHFPTIDRPNIITPQQQTDISFTTPGEHHLNLIVNDINGCTDTISKWLKVYDIQPELSLDRHDWCLGKTTIFDPTASSADTTIVTVNQDYHDGDVATFNSLTINQHVYDTIYYHYHSQFKIDTFPSYPALTITDILGCQESLTVPLEYYKVNTSINHPTTVKICEGTEVPYTPTNTYTRGTLEHTWSFDNVIPDNNNITNNVTYANNGVFNTRLISEELETTCKDTAYTTVSVQSYPSANFGYSFDDQPYICNYEKNIFFNDQSSFDITDTTYNIPKIENYIGYIDLKNDGNFITYNPDSPPATFYERGEHKVNYKVVSSHGCESEATKELSVKGPEGHFTTDKTIICKGDSIFFALKDTIDVLGWSFDFGDGTIVDNIDSISHIYSFHPPTGKTKATLKLQDIGGVCNENPSQPIIIEIQPVVADFERNNMDMDTSKCLFDDYIVFNKSQGADIVHWDFGNNTTSTEKDIVFPKYEVDGTYEITLAIENTTNGCVDTMRKKAVIFPLPVVEAQGDTTCFDGNAKLTVLNPNNDNTYSWSPSDYLIKVDTAIADIANAQQSLEYIVITADTNNCKGRDTVPLLVILPPTGYDLDTSIVIGDYVTLPLNKEDYHKLSWTPEDGLSCLDCSNPQVQPLEEAFYEVAVSDSFDLCPINTFNYHIDILPNTFVDVPTAFTPNDDGNNDIIYARGWGVKELIYFKVFNRWGELLFETDDMDIGWDGFYENNLQNIDTYIYKVRAKTWKNDEIINKEGHFSLLR